MKDDKRLLQRRFVNDVFKGLGEVQLQKDGFINGLICLIGEFQHVFQHEKQPWFAQDSNPDQCNHHILAIDVISIGD
jgi:hypothetical protein